MTATASTTSASPATATPTRPSSPTRAWTVRVNADFAADGTLTPRQFFLMFILERLWRDRSYCWVSNRELAKLYGCGSVSTVKEILAELVALKIIKRIMTDKGRPGRIGIFALKRLDADRPTDDDATIDDSIDRLKTRKPAGNPPSEGPEIRPSQGAGNPATELRQSRCLDTPHS